MPFPSRCKWDEPMKETVQKCGKTFSSRYIGSMVGDVHHTLHCGGVFGYPGDSKHPNGKLRLLYETAPMSFIVEQAGGLSTTGRQRVTEMVPAIVHHRDPVEEVIEAYASWKQW